ncbi:hypothetical protein ACFY7H_33790 [Streptomyces sp. NPDC012794]|uniref:hypothetical protein n=1 Tax=Streptomyces sp. NPDC012794 TaxID=3364850 RepID=UPI0036A0CC52
MPNLLRVKALPDVPRWAAVAAHAVPLIAVPSGLWRIALVVGLPVAAAPVTTVPGAAYVLFLSVLSECLALLTLGLVRGWGETVPHWIPYLGRRRVPPLAAVVPALLGAAAGAALVAWFTYANVVGIGEGTIGSPAQDIFLLVCYVPLVAWPPLLAAVALAYHRRRKAAAPVMAMGGPR